MCWPTRTLDYFTMFPYNGNIVKRNYNLEKLEKLEYFNLEVLRKFVDLEGTSLYKFVMRKVKQKKFIYIKKGLYTTSEYLKNVDRDIFVERIANIIKVPSYISMEYMLDKYSILSESVFIITSLTTKKTNNYNNDFGRFYYRNIDDSLFDGFFLNNGIYYATKAKAIFDFFYFKPKDVALEEYRLNLSEITSKDIEEFGRYAIKSKKLLILYEELKNHVH